MILPKIYHEISVFLRTTPRYLLTFSYELSWNDHIDDMFNRAAIRIDILSYPKYSLDRYTQEMVYKWYIRPISEYSDVIMSNMNEQQI